MNMTEVERPLDLYQDLVLVFPLPCLYLKLSACLISEEEELLFHPRPGA